MIETSLKIARKYSAIFVHVRKCLENDGNCSYELKKSLGNVQKTSEIFRKCSEIFRKLQKISLMLLFI